MLHILTISLQIVHRNFRYDKLAFRYVSYVAIPLLAGYTIYSLLYNTHKGWYSFIISTLTSFVYMFGFVSGSFHTVSMTTYTNKRVTGTTGPSTDY